MRILIAGAGGVGGYIGSQLILHTDAEVVFLARKEHLKAIQKEGLKVIDNKEEFIVKPSKAVENAQSEGIFDLIIIGVKSYDLENVLKGLSSNIGKETVILPLLNGIEYDKTVKKLYPQANILKGCVYIISNIKSPGVIVKKGKVFKLCWGGSKEFKNIANLFNRAKLRHKQTEDIDYEIWKKFLFISAMAALTSYYKKSMDVIVKEHSNELKELFNEITALAQKLSIPLTQDDVNSALAQASKVTEGAKTSMQLDLEKGKKSEIDSLLGSVINLSKKHGIKTPLMEKIYNELAG